MLKARVNRYAVYIILLSFMYRNIFSMELNASRINDKDSFGFTPLHTAVFQQHSSEEVEQLLKNGADPNIPYCNYNCLALEIFNGRLPERIELLLLHGANPNGQDALGKTSCHLALRDWQKLQIHQIIDVFLHYDTKFSIQDNQGNTSLHSAVETGSLPLCNQFATVRSLLPTAKIMLLIRQRKIKNNKSLWPKPLFFKIMGYMSLIKHENYKAKKSEIDEALRKKNYNNQTPYDILCAYHKEALGTLRVLKKYKKSNNTVNVVRAIVEQGRYIKELKQLKKAYSLD